MNSSKPECFVIQPIGKPDSPTRKHADKVVKHLIEPVAGEHFAIARADKLGKPGIITTQIVEHLLDAELVIADLTDWNPNVMYELALRHVTRRPLVHLMKEGEKLPFDVSLMRTVFYDLTDPDSLEAARVELAAHVDAMRADPKDIDTPVSTALDIKSLRSSSDLVEKSLGDIRTSLAELQADIRQLMPRIGVPFTGIPSLPPGALYEFRAIEPREDYDEGQPEDYEEDREPDFDDIGD
jgi:hypothetical protein